MLQGSLFTRDWLTEGVLETPEWSRLDAISELASRITTKVADVAGRASINEAQTERDLIWPVLHELGWTSVSVQENMAAKGRSDVPDGLLYLDASAKEVAEKREPWARFELGACLVEAKRWALPLDRAGKLDPQAPSTQLMHYLRRADDITAGKLRWGILTNGRIWRLYWQGALSVAEDFLEIDLAKAVGVAPLDLLDGGDSAPAHALKLFVLLFGRDAFVPNEAGTTLHQRALAAGRQWEARVAADLSDIVFDKVFPQLVRALPVADRERPTLPSSAYLDEVRSGALILLYRLLFVLYAEDRNLLPDEHGPYKAYALTSLRHEIAERIGSASAYSERLTTIWDRLSGIFHAIADGDDSLGIPPYNGGLFAHTAAPLLERLRLPDSVIAPLLFELSHLPGPRGPRYINYRDLSVQQLGSIYESILEYGVELKPDGSIGPVEDYAARHRSGSFYTPEELVGLIIDKAVGPLIIEHRQAFEAALASGGGRSAAEAADPAVAITMLRIVDPAMGSGHFLVSLVDWLADRVLTAMGDATAAAEAAGIKGYTSPLAGRIAAIREAILSNAAKRGWPIVEDQLDDRHIVRRIVLKRCVYGVDLNPMAVELAKVALWLHSFTVGAPLSFLDHHLRCGNSLLGAWVRPTTLSLANRGSLFITGKLAQMDTVARTMERIETNTDSDVAQVAESKAGFETVEDVTRPLAAFFDIITAEEAAGVFKAGGKRPRETANDLAKRGASAAVVARARAAETAFQKAEALQYVFEGSFGDPFAIASGSQPIIGPDERQQLALLPPEAPEQASLLPSVRPDDRRRLVAADLLDELRGFADANRLMHWELAFPGVWNDLGSSGRTGGFDAVIGNPPYVRQELLQAIKPALQNAYASFDGMADLYVYFYEQGLKLLRPGGRMSYVVTNKWLKAGYAERLRKLFAEEAWVEFVADFGHAKHLFADADVFPCVISVRRPDGGPAPETFDLAVIPRENVPRSGLAAAVAAAKAPAPLTILSRESWTLEPPAEAALLEKVQENGISLEEAAGCRPLYGLKTGFNDAFLINAANRDRLVAADPSCRDILRPYLRGQDIDRWQPDWAGLWMIVMKSSGDHRWAWASAVDEAEAERLFAATHPGLYQHFKRFEAALRNRQDQGRWWWELRPCAYYDAFDAPKVFYVDIAWSGSFGVDDQGRYSNNTGYFIPTGDRSIAAAMNAPIGWWYAWRRAQHGKDEALRYFTDFVADYPLPRFSPADREILEREVGILAALTTNTRDADKAVGDWLKTEIGMPKLTRPLQMASLMDADAFVGAVRAALPKKQALSAATLKRLRDEYDATIAPAREQRAAIQAHERTVSDVVNAAYGLTPDDVALMWNTAPPRMPIPAPPTTAPFGS